MPNFLNSCVASLNLRLTSSNTRVWRIKARVGRLKIRVRRLKGHVGRLNARVEAIKPIKNFSPNVNFTYELKPRTKQTGGAHIFTSTRLWKVSMWSLSYHQILAAGKVESISGHVLKTTEKSLLSKGLNFAIPPKHINYADYMLLFELLYRDVDSLEASISTKSLSKVGSETLLFHHTTILAKLLRRTYPKQNLMHWKSLLKTKIL